MRRERAASDVAGDARDRRLEQRVTDGTAAYLDSLKDPRIRVVHSEKNIGQNAYAEAFQLTTAPYLVELDDDVVNAPPEWDATLRDAFLRLPEIGFLAADLENDPHDPASRMKHEVRPHQYTLVEENGVRLLTGPAGGGCAMTSRELNTRVGGFRQDKKRVFWLEDHAISTTSRGSAFELRCSPISRFITPAGRITRWPRRRRTSIGARTGRTARAGCAIKKIVFRLPFFHRLNTHFGWFEPPAPIERQ